MEKRCQNFWGCQDLIDTLVILGHWPFRKVGLDFNYLEEKMKENKIEKAIIINVNGAFYRDVHDSNIELFQAVKKSILGDKLIPFGTINPLFPGWKDDLLEAIESFNFKGFNLFPNYHKYSLLDPRLEDFWEIIRAKKIFISFVIKFEDPRQRHYLDVSDIPESEIIDFLRKYPDIKVIIHNISYRSALDIVFSNPYNNNIFFDMNFFYDVPIGETIKFVDMVGKERIVFASFYPFRYYTVGLWKLKEVGIEPANFGKCFENFFEGGESHGFI